MTHNVDIDDRLEEIDFHLQCMGTLHDYFMFVAGHNPQPFEGAAGGILKKFCYSLSACVFAYRSAWLHVSAACARNADAALWSAREGAGHPALKALVALSSVEIRRQMIDTAIPVERLATSGFRFNADVLSASADLSADLPSIQYLLSQPVIDTMREGMLDLTRVVEEARNRGFV